MNAINHEDWNLLYDFPEVALSNDYIIATYMANTATTNVEAFAKALADEQSTGTWIAVGGETKEIQKKFGAKVVSVYEIPDWTTEEAPGERFVVIQVAFPTHNLGTNIPMLLSTVIGNVSSAGKLKFIDCSFPESYVKKFKGPKFGIEGLREKLGVYDRPLLNAMIKPNVGWTPQEGVKLFYEAAKGGCDVIKDDELLPADEINCPLTERVKLFIEAEKRVYEETGEHTLYCTNITDEANKLRDNALRAIDAGANALMVNFYTTGFSAAKALCEDPEINVPIMAHIDFAGSMISSEIYGVSAPLLCGKLSRMAGADLAIFGSTYGKFPLSKRTYLRTARNFTQPFWDIKPTLMAASGGTTQLIVPQVIKDLGTDCIIAAGGAVHGHPQGSFAGAKSMRQAIDAAMKNIPLEEAINDAPELAAMVKKLGWEPRANFDLMK